MEVHVQICTLIKWCFHTHVYIKRPPKEQEQRAMQGGHSQPDGSSHQPEATSDGLYASQATEGTQMESENDPGSNPGAVVKKKCGK